MKKQYIIPVTWEMTADLKIEAESLADAVNLVEYMSTRDGARNITTNASLVAGLPTYIRESLDIEKSELADKYPDEEF